MRRSRPARHPLALAATLLAAAACARGTGVESEPGPAYVLEVSNPSTAPMIVSYDDGTGIRLLGTVGARSDARFVVTRPASRTITVHATDEQRTRTVQRTVTLTPGEPTNVVLDA